MTVLEADPTCPTVYQLGDAPTVVCEFRDRSGTLTDPGVVSVSEVTPGGMQKDTTAPDPAIANPAVGVWEYTFQNVFAESGVWVVKFFGSSGLVAAAEIDIPVADSVVT